MSAIRRLGILTSGGDCPGLNAAIRAVVSRATLGYGWEVLGLPYATQGLLERRAIRFTVHGFDRRGIDPLLSTGGTVLGSINRGDTEAQAAEILQGYRDLGLDALVAIGGDGSLAILHHLARKGGWKLVGIPKTIDNDVGLTQRAIGFDTAVNTVTEALARLSYTAASHDRVMVVEVMGREAGHLALQAGIAGGADAILVPEIPYRIRDLGESIRDLRDRWNRRFAIIVVAEGAHNQRGEELLQRDALGNCHYGGIGNDLAAQLSRYWDGELDVRVTVLGHVQRGGMPSAFDRMMATVMGTRAVDCLAADQSGVMITWQGDRCEPRSLDEVVENSPLMVDPEGELVRAALGMGIYLGHPTEASPRGPACPRQPLMPIRPRPGAWSPV